MYRTIIKILVLVMALTLALDAFAQKNDVRFAYDVNFDMNFDNREFYKSRFSRSMTIFGARLTPSVGISVDHYNSLTHKVMIGVDVMKDFGASPVVAGVVDGESPETSKKLNNTDLFREILLYYRLDKSTDRSEFSLHAGIFPRSMMKGEYSEVFFSDSLRFYDNNIEGLLMTFRRPASYFELGCDWMGQYGIDRREKFMIFSSGSGNVAPFLTLGYSAYMYHFASSDSVHGVVDNILLNPYAAAEFGQMAGIQKLSARLGWIQAMQHDRANVGKYVFPGGGELRFDVRNWNVGISNTLFVGTDLMPYYNHKDGGGYKYGNRLYMGDPFYRIFDTPGGTGIGTYDRLEAYYEPKIGTYLKLRIAAIFHFNNMKYSGTQQMVQLNFNLQELLSRKRN